MTLPLKDLNTEQSLRRLVKAHCNSVGFIMAAILYGCSQSQTATPVPNTSSHPPQTISEIKAAAIPALSPRERVHIASVDGDWFQEQAGELGIESSYSDGSVSGFYQLIESVGGGVAVFDFDNDAQMDLYLTGGGDLIKSGVKILDKGRAGKLFRNRSTCQFDLVQNELNSLQDSSLFTHGCTVFDFNADGFDDLLVVGFTGVKFYCNQGDGSFQEMANAMGLRSTAWNVSAAAGDLNRDGLVDLYVVTYADSPLDAARTCMNDQGLRDICGPTLFPGTQDVMFENTGEGFIDVTSRVGLVPKNRGLGIVIADLDANGFLDVFVANDVEENQLYFGEESGVFTENGILSGVAYSNSGEREASMGVDVGDFDGDGRPDLWYANYAQQDNSLLRNFGNRGFLHSADVMGLGGVSRPWVGFGTEFADFDGDGWDDLYVVNGHVTYERRDSPYYQPPQLFRNINGSNFVDVSSQGGPYFKSTWSARGSATWDWNNDGSLDLVVVHQNEPAVVLTNRHIQSNWISVELVGTKSDRNAIGSYVMIDVDGRTITRWKHSGGSYLSHSDPRLLFGLSVAEPIRATVALDRWLNGDLF